MYVCQIILQINQIFCRILSQLHESLRAKFPVILTRKYACHVSVVSLLRSRHLGNSTTAFRNSLLEVHSDQWLKKTLSYLSDCDCHRKGVVGIGTQPQYQPPLPFPPFPTAR